MLRPLVLLLAAAALGAAPFAAAQKSAADPKPETYLCPDATDGKAVDCYLDAVQHLYTMCRQIKSIEIIEFGYEKSEEGVNGAKTEYCIDKHRASIARPYQAALKEATHSRSALDHLRALHELWLKALVELKWIPGETDAQYKERIAKPYAAFAEETTLVKTALDQDHAAAGAKTAKPGKAHPAATRAAHAQASAAASKGPN